MLSQRVTGFTEEKVDSTAVAMLMEVKKRREKMKKKRMKKEKEKKFTQCRSAASEMTEDDGRVLVAVRQQGILVATPLQPIVIFHTTLMLSSFTNGNSQRHAVGGDLLSWTTPIGDG